MKYKKEEDKENDDDDKNKDDDKEENQKKTIHKRDLYGTKKMRPQTHINVETNQTE